MQPTTPLPRYELELWINGVQVGDISRLAQNRKYTIKRNDSEELTFDLNLTAFEDYCAAAGRLPQAMLEPYVTDVRVKRNGTYMFGVQVVDMNFTFGENDPNIAVKCTGFLDLFRDRYVTKSYDPEVEATEIAWDLIDTTQTIAGDFGVTEGATYDTGVERVRNYVDQNVKDAIVNLTDLIDGNFDFDFSYDRTFNIYEKIGSDRENLPFTWPYNIQSLTTPRTGLNTYNYIIALGSGFGEETLRSEIGDAASRANYGTREKIVSFNSVSEQETLDDHAAAELAKSKDLLVLPKLSVTGKFCDLGVIGIGDRIPVSVSRPAINLSGMYRIEQIDVDLDENDAESIDLTVDTYSV